MPRNRFDPLTLLLALLPGPALAHGDTGTLLAPVGIMAAAAALLLVPSFRLARAPVRMAAVAAAIAASVSFGFVPISYFPSAMQHTAWGYFLVGFLPAFLAGRLTLWLFRGRPHNGA